ncbi:MAG: hypothetical protein QMD01_01200 [Thermodesulfovibrionales bacterium]|nr:hypothetical protein [Thermodesulfovibrionales bacterium]
MKPLKKNSSGTETPMSWNVRVATDGITNALFEKMRKAEKGIIAAKDMTRPIIISLDDNLKFNFSKKNMGINMRYNGIRYTKTKGLIK